MDKNLFKLNKDLSILELEDRQELTLAIASDGIEASKGDDNDVTIIRCGGNSGN